MFNFSKMQAMDQYKLKYTGSPCNARYCVKWNTCISALVSGNKEPPKSWYGSDMHMFQLIVLWTARTTLICQLGKGTSTEFVQKTDLNESSTFGGQSWTEKLKVTFCHTISIKHNKASLRPAKKISFWFEPVLHIRKRRTAISISFLDACHWHFSNLWYLWLCAYYIK